MNAPVQAPEVSVFDNEASKIDPKIQVSGSTYQHCPDGSRAFQVPVEDRFGVAYDIVAWPVDDPNVWWTRRGLATVLGEHALFVAEWRGAAVRLYATPRDWLFSRDPMAVCIVDWSSNLRQALGAAPEVICQTAPLKSELERRLYQQVRPAFAISVRGKRDAA